MAEIQEGDEVRTGLPVVDVVNPATMRVRARVNQADVRELKIGQQVQRRPRRVSGAVVRRHHHADLSDRRAVVALAEGPQLHRADLGRAGRHPNLMPDSDRVARRRARAHRPARSSCRGTRSASTASRRTSACSAAGRSSGGTSPWATLNAHEVVVQSGLAEGDGVARNVDGRGHPMTAWRRPRAPRRRDLSRSAAAVGIGGVCDRHARRRGAGRPDRRGHARRVRRLPAGARRHRPAKSIVLAAPMQAGELQIVKLAKNGGAVKPGDVLVEFDGTSLRQRMQEKQSELKQADAEIAQVQAQQRITLQQDETGGHARQVRARSREARSRQARSGVEARIRTGQALGGRRRAEAASRPSRRPRRTRSAPTPTCRPSCGSAKRRSSISSAPGSGWLRW